MINLDRINFISDWIKDYANQNVKKPFNLVVGVSGGIDSSVTSVLCAKTNLKTIVVSMPIRQNDNEHMLSLKHIKWLESNFTNVESYIISLEDVFNKFEYVMKDFKSDLAFANSRARLRMTTLYQIAQSNNALVVGTGNKVEDFGIGFFTKYGDGGVDISPIADCNKTEVWEMGSLLGISKDIIEAKPTDGLWDDNRKDEDQIGLTYEQLEEAMGNKNSKYFKKYNQLRAKNLHKILPIPICRFEKK